MAANDSDKQEAIKRAFRMPPRYELKDVLGQGAYGVVASALDREHGGTVAVKKIERVFDHPTFTKRTLREIRVLRFLTHENIISLKSIFATTIATSGGEQGSARFDDLYLVFDLMQTDLASIIKSPQPLSAQHIQFFLYQLLRGLKFLHSAGIIHRDIKPRNLLVNSNCDLKICDMGLARFDNSLLTPPPPTEERNAVPEMTDYVATRWYRAPEIILQWSAYSKAIDIWAVGCILAELLGRKPIFPGTDADHQITLICDVLGRPSEDLVARCPHAETREFLEALPLKPRRPLVGMYSKTADMNALALLTRLLRLNPDTRPTVNECLKHAYLGQLHCASDEPESEPLELERDFPFDASPTTTSEDLAEYVWREIELMGALYEADETPALATASTTAKQRLGASAHASSPLTGKRAPPVPSPRGGGDRNAAVQKRSPRPPTTSAPPKGVPRPVPKPKPVPSASTRSGTSTTTALSVQSPPTGSCLQGKKEVTTTPGGSRSKLEHGVHNNSSSSAATAAATSTALLSSTSSG